MKLFQGAQTTYGILGITPHQSIQKYPINWKILMVSLFHVSNITFCLMNYEKEVKSANSFAEYSDWIFLFTSVVSVATYFAITVLHSSKLFKYIDNCEKIVQKSESNQNLKPNPSGKKTEWLLSQKTSQRLPFDWENLAGFLFATNILYVITIYFFLYVSSLTSFGIGNFLLFNAIARDIRSDLNSIRVNNKTRRNQRTSVEQINKFIQFFSIFKQLSE